MIKELTQIELEKRLSSESATQKNNQLLTKSRIQTSSLEQMEESKIVKTFKMIDESIHEDTIK